MSLVTVRVKNLLANEIKEDFPIYGVIAVKPGATARVPVDVAIAWADPDRHFDPGVGGGPVVQILDPIGGFVPEDENNDPPFEEETPKKATKKREITPPPLD